MKVKKLLKCKPLKFGLLIARSLVISTILVATFLKIPIPSSLGWLDSSWEYRKPISVSNSGSDLTDEDVLVEIDTASLVTAGKLQSDCDDLRFTDSDESTALSYWVEGGCNTSATQVWVRIPSLPSGGKTIYMYYGNNAAVNAQTSWSGNFILLSSSVCPSGWTRSTTFDDKYTYGASTYGTSSDGNHNHGQASGTTGYSIGGSPYDSANDDSPDGSGFRVNHTHTNAKVDVNNTIIEPSYVGLYFCTSDSLTHFPDSLGIFNTSSTTLPSGYSYYSSLEGKYPRGSSSFVASGGSSVHTHTTTGGYLTDATSSFATDDYNASGTTCNTHTHTTLDGTTGSGDNNIPYYEVVYGQTSSTKIASEGIIEMTTVLPPLGWTRFTSLDSKFPKGATTAGGSYAGATHTHSITINTGTASASKANVWTTTGNVYVHTTHTHSATVTSSAVQALPAYVTTIFAQRKSSVSITLGEESTQNTAPYAPSYIQIEGLDNTPTIPDFTPEFSAIFSDADGDDTGNYYQIEVNTSSDFTGTVMWDSTKTAVMPAISNGGRSSEISYAGDTLISGNTYYWRIKFWDSNTYNSESDWSATGQFTMDAAPTVISTNISNSSDIYADIPITIQTVYSDPDGSSDLDRLYLQLHNPSSSTDIEYYISPTGSDQTEQYPTPISGSEYISGITYDTQYNTPSSTDITVTWHITANWTWAQASDISYGIKALDNGGISSEYSYTSTLYSYENRLIFSGNLSVKDSQNNDITTAWYPASNPMTVSGAKVTYYGTTDLYPQDSQFDVKIVNEELTEWYDTTSSGENFSIDCTAPTISNAEDTYTISIVNIPSGLSTATLTFNIKTDAHNPVISPLVSTSHSSESTWYESLTGDISWAIEDDQSGIYKSWRLIDQTQNQTLQNISTNGTEIESSGTYNFAINQDGTWYIHIASVDNVGLNTIQTYKLQIDSQNPTFSSVSSTTHPSQTSWYSNRISTITWQAQDLGSGISKVWAYPSSRTTEEVSVISTSGTEKTSSDSFTMTDLNNGIWYLHLLAQDNTGRTSYTKYIVKIDASTPDIVDIVGNYEGILQNIDSGPAISWTSPNSASGDMYYITNNGTEPTSSNYTYSTAATTYNLPSQKEGDTTIKVRALNGAGAYSITRTFLIRYDSVAPTNVSALKAEIADKGLSLSWRNPIDSDFQKLVIIKNENRIPTSISDGSKIYEGTASEYLDQNVLDEKTYYYAIYVYDIVGNISSGSVITSPTSTPETTEESKIVEVANLGTGKQVSVSINNLAPTVLSTNNLHVYSEQIVDIVVPAQTIKDEISNPSQVILVVGTQIYSMSYDDQSNSYTARITSPSVKGAYDTQIQVISASNESTLTLSLSLLVDPYGYIYMMSGGNEVRISNAKVSLYTKIDDEEILWTPVSGETNPQYTNQQGEYQFFVQPGEYKLVAEASGYIPTETEWFTVETNIIEKNIEIKKNHVVLYTILGLAEVAIGLCIAICLKKRKRKLKSSN